MTPTAFALASRTALTNDLVEALRGARNQLIRIAAKYPEIDVEAEIAAANAALAASVYAPSERGA